jgi:hypothetical protein
MVPRVIEILVRVLVAITSARTAGRPLLADRLEAMHHAKYIGGRILNQTQGRIRHDGPVGARPHRHVYHCGGPSSHRMRSSQRCRRAISLATRSKDGVYACRDCRRIRVVLRRSLVGDLQYKRSPILVRYINRFGSDRLYKRFSFGERKMTSRGPPTLGKRDMDFEASRNEDT